MANKTIYIDPLRVKIDNFEDLLVTDNLFVEYFNEFLQLPTFPEPLCFNRETGGFEIVSTEKHEIARKIKAAIRAGSKKSRIFYAVRHHAFKPIPKILLEKPKDDGRLEINTSFSVKTLNKEQGIEWIKSERLPAFLESDTYVEYRLAKILSQIQPENKTEQFFTYHLDRRPPSPESESSMQLGDEFEKINQLNQQDQQKQDDMIVRKTENIRNNLLNDMFVSTGETSTYQTDMWIAQAQLMHQQTTSTPTMSTTPTALLHGLESREQTKDSDFLTRYLDSGLGSSEPCSRIQTAKNQYPRPSDPVCSVADNMNKINPVTLSSRNITYYTGGGAQEKGVKFAEDSEKVKINQVDCYEEDFDDNNDDDAFEKKDSKLTFSSVDELGHVIAAMAIKSAIANVVGMDIEEVASYQNIKNLYPSEKYLNIDNFIVDGAVCTIKKPNMQEIIENEAAEMKEKKSDDVNSDKDSLLESDEDNEYDDKAENNFQLGDGGVENKHKMEKHYRLDRISGIRQFGTFLNDTNGESHWLIWHDIDRLQFVPDDQLFQYTSAMRERFHAHSAPYRLTDQVLRSLKLEKPYDWNKDHLISIQHLLLEPLLKYWGPKFLLQQSEKNKPRVKPIPTRLTYSHQHPLLPRRKPAVPQRTIQISEAFSSYSPQKACEFSKSLIENRPSSATNLRNNNVGSKNAPSLIRPSTARPGIDNRKKLDVKTPKQLIEAKLKIEVKEREEISNKLFKKRQTNRRKSDDSSSVSSNDSAISSPKSDRSAVDTTKRPTSAAVSVKSDWSGGSRMRGLLEALASERRSGGVFGKFVEKSGNWLWSNCLEFWQSVYDFVMTFDDPTVSMFDLRRKANGLFAKYIVDGSKCCIGAAEFMRKDIEKRLDPPFDDLFAPAEELVLDELYEAWSRFLLDDCATFEKVQLIDVTRRLGANSKHILALQRRGVIKETADDDDDENNISMDDYADPVYDESLFDKIPEEFRDYTLEQLVHNKMELEHFRKFLAGNFASLDLLCWMDIETFKRIAHGEDKRREDKAKEIRVKYLTKKYFFGANSPAGKDTQNELMKSVGGWGKLLSERPPTQLLIDVQKIVENRLVKKWLPLFLATEEFVNRQRPATGMSDVVEDIGIQRRRKTNTLHKSVLMPSFDFNTRIFRDRRGSNIDISKLDYRQFEALYRLTVNNESPQDINVKKLVDDINVINVARQNPNPYHSSWKFVNLQMLDSKWISSGKDVLVFRKALLNPMTSMQFRKFVSMNGDHMENNVLFWQEVQRYKEICHNHCDRSVISGKIQSIINCFIDSAIPPSLQIDIGYDTAEKIMQKKNEGGPYLFREAQLTVFRELFEYWEAFCKYKQKLSDDKILPTIERHKRKAKMRRREKERIIEMQREAETLEKQKLNAENADFDPFADQNFNEKQPPTTSHLTWTYGQYMNALDREDILNKIDKSSFSSSNISITSFPVTSERRPKSGKIEFCNSPNDIVKPVQKKQLKSALKQPKH